MPIVGILIVLGAGVTGLLYWKYQQALSQSQAGAGPGSFELPDLTSIASTAEQLPLVGKYFVDLQAVERMSRAIAFAEGFYNAGSRPARNHNPGDLTLDIGGNDIHPVGFDGPYAIYASDEDGFADLQAQILLWLTGKSRVAGPTDTILSLSRKYTTTEQDGWANNVASYLGVPVTTKLSSLA